MPLTICGQKCARMGGRLGGANRWDGPSHCGLGHGYPSERLQNMNCGGQNVGGA